MGADASAAVRDGVPRRLLAPPISITSGAQHDQPRVDVQERELLTNACGNPTPVSCQTAISYAEALAHDQANPGDRWVLRDSSGNPIYNRSLHERVYANVGSASYRQAALNHLLGSLRSHAGWNGVFFDESDACYYNDTGTRSTATPPRPPIRPTRAGRRR